MNGDAKGVVCERLDRGERHLATIADDEETEAHDDGCAVDEKSGPEELPVS